MICNAANDGASITWIKTLIKHEDWKFDAEGGRPVFTGVDGDKSTTYSRAVEVYVEIQRKCLENGTVSGTLTTDDDMTYVVSANVPIIYWNVPCQIAMAAPQAKTSLLLSKWSAA